MKFQLLVPIVLLSVSLVPLQKMNVAQMRASPEMFQGDLVLAGNNVTIIEGQFDINGSILVEGNATLVLRNAAVNFALTHNGQFNMSFRNPSSGNPHLVVENASINSNNCYMTVNLFENSSADLNGFKLGTDLAIPYPYILLYRESSATIRNSTITYIPVMGNAELAASNCSLAILGAHDNSSAALTDCTIDSAFIGDAADLTLTNCTLNVNAEIQAADLNYSLAGLAPGFFKYWSFTTNCTVQGPAIPRLTMVDAHVGNWSFISQGYSRATISDSEIRTLRFLDSSSGQLSNLRTGWIVSHDNSTAGVYDSVTDWVFAYNNSRVWLTNSTTGNCIAEDESEIGFNWYLDVFVKDSVDQPVASANVTVAFPNATLAGSRLTDGYGHARLTLLERTRNATGQHPVGDYEITATFETYSNSTTFGIEGNQQLEIAFAGLVIPEIPSLLVLPTFLMITLVALVVFKKTETMK